MYRIAINKYINSLWRNAYCTRQVIKYFNLITAIAVDEQDGYVDVVVEGIELVDTSIPT